MLLIMNESMDNHNLFSYLLFALDCITFAWMAFELILRIITCPKRIQFFVNFYTVVDVLALVTYIVQFYYGVNYHKATTITPLIKTNHKNIEIFSIVRLIRFFRFFRYSNGLQIIKYTLIASSKELLLLALLLLLPVAFFATVVYFVEREVKGVFIHYLVSPSQ